MIVCTFAGHREIRHPQIEKQIQRALSQILVSDQEFVFLSGGMGEFDRKCESAVLAAKQQYRQSKIRLCLVLPYMYARLNTERRITA